MFAGKDAIGAMFVDKDGFGRLSNQRVVYRTLFNRLSVFCRVDIRTILDGSVAPTFWGGLVVAAGGRRVLRSSVLR
jgi:hypothetical protein